MAMDSISNNTPKGNCFTATHERAGKWVLALKYLPYTLLNKGNWLSMSVKKMVFLTMWSNDELDASKMFLTFWITCSAAASTEVSVKGLFSEV